MRSKALPVITLLIGVVLLAMPFAYSMFDRASAGADMMDAFEPVLTRPNVTTFQGHMKTFGDMSADITKMMPVLAENMKMTQDELNQMLGQQFPGVANGMQQVDTMGKDFNTVITVMDQNVTNFEKANKLPMRILPWALLIFGVALVAVSALQLVGAKKAAVTA